MAEIEDEPMHFPLTSDTPIGTKVVCIDSSDSGDRLVENEIYTVLHFETRFDHPYVQLEEIYSSIGFFLERFEIA